MELKNLRTFQAVVDQGSYQRAAERLGYAQSTITVQIQQLEEELGVPLFERLGRRMVLTEAGERILPQARELLLGAERLLESGREDGVLSGILRVDMAETLLCYKPRPCTAHPGPAGDPELQLHADPHQRADRGLRPGGRL